MRSTRVQQALVRAFLAGEQTVSREQLQCSRCTLPHYALLGIVWPLRVPRGAPHLYRFTEHTAAWVEDLQERERRRAARAKLTADEWLDRHGHQLTA